jgi:8-oxo-dGTP pyrophosphatase MutT (NUDIX family)
MDNTQVSVALAILYQEGKFLMQLRDEIEGIAYPGHWGLFGGHLELNETPENAVKREILEEINYTLSNPIKFNTYYTSKLIRHVYYASLTVNLNQLQLLEGWDFALVTPSDIKKGFCYSEKAQAEKPLGKPHQEILLDFLTINN